MKWLCCNSEIYLNICSFNATAWLINCSSFLLISAINMVTANHLLPAPHPMAGICRDSNTHFWRDLIEPECAIRTLSSKNGVLCSDYRLLLQITKGKAWRLYALVSTLTSWISFEEIYRSSTCCFGHSKTTLYMEEFRKQVQGRRQIQKRAEKTLGFHCRLIPSTETP